jgi:hypothetical protein
VIFAIVVTPSLLLKTSKNVFYALFFLSGINIAHEVLEQRMRCVRGMLESLIE